MRRAARYYREVAAIGRDQDGAHYRELAAAAPVSVSYGPCPAHPAGWTAHPRRNLTAAAESAERAAAEFRAMADRIEARLAAGL